MTDLNYTEPCPHCSAPSKRLLHPAWHCGSTEMMQSHECKDNQIAQRDAVIEQAQRNTEEILGTISRLEAHVAELEHKLSGRAAGYPLVGQVKP